MKMFAPLLLMFMMHSFLNAQSARKDALGCPDARNLYNDQRLQGSKHIEDLELFMLHYQYKNFEAARDDYKALFAQGDRRVTDILRSQANCWPEFVALTPPVVPPNPPPPNGCPSASNLPDYLSYLRDSHGLDIKLNGIGLDRLVADYGHGYYQGAGLEYKTFIKDEREAMLLPDSTEGKFDDIDAFFAQTADCWQLVTTVSLYGPGHVALEDTLSAPLRVEQIRAAIQKISLCPCDTVNISVTPNLPLGRYELIDISLQKNIKALTLYLGEPQTSVIEHIAPKDPALALLSESERIDFNASKAQIIRANETLGKIRELDRTANDETRSLVDLENNLVTGSIGIADLLETYNRTTIPIYLKQAGSRKTEIKQQLASNKIRLDSVFWGDAQRKLTTALDYLPLQKGYAVRSIFNDLISGECLSCARH